MEEARTSEAPARRHGPAFGDGEPPPTGEPKEQAEATLDRRTEAMLAVAIVVPVVAAYGALAYGVYSAVGSI